MATRALNPRRPVARARPTRPRRTPPRPGRGRGAVIRRRLIAAAIALVVLYAGYMLWFRNLSWFAINEVTVTGATTNEPQIKMAVEQAARDMTTLHLKDGELRDAVARLPDRRRPWAPARASRTRSTDGHRAAARCVHQGRPATDRGLGRRLPPARGELRPEAPAPDRGSRCPRAPGSTGDAAAQAAILGATPAAPSRPRHRLELGRRAGRGGGGPRRRPRPPLRRRFQGPGQVDGGGLGALELRARLAVLSRRQRPGPARHGRLSTGRADSPALQRRLSRRFRAYRRSLADGEMRRHDGRGIRLFAGISATLDQPCTSICRRDLPRWNSQA